MKYFYPNFLKSLLGLQKKKMEKNISFSIFAKLIISLIFSVSILQNATSQIVTNTYTTNQVFTVPLGVTSVKVECWGGGGKGSNISNTIDIGGGGGGGAYASSTLCVTPGDAYTINIGAGGTGATANGGTTYFGNVSLVMAKGGAGLTENIFTGASGGLASESVGQVKYSGGSGGARTSYVILVALAYRAGGGGGGAGSTGVGNNAVGTVAGATKADFGGQGATGADGGLLNLLGGFHGTAGSNYGGGGSGAARGLLFSSPIYNGGNGAPGLVRISYELYVCQATAETVWNGTAWSNGIPEACKKAIINGDYNTALNGNFTACSCQINAGKRLIVGDGTNSDYVSIYNQLENNGILVINNNASLLQHYSARNNAGTVAMHRYTQPMYRYDFTYWSSPLTQDSNFTLHTLSPNTLLDKYNYWNAVTQAWTTSLNGTEVMVPGKGYIVRAPQTYSLNPTQVVSYRDGVFVGKPNNGDISIAIFGSNSADPLSRKWNLIGNPYPSGIDIENFLTVNNTKLDGTAYLWTHNTPPDSNGAYTASDYAVYNLTGPVGTAPGANTPTKYFASGQSFFVKGISNGASTVVFKNEMRVNNFNNQFFRMAPIQAVENSTTTGKHRIWLNLTNNQGAFSQALIGYIENATNGIDWGYDGDLFGGNYVSFYSTIDNAKLSVQGRALPFDDEDIVPLGYKTTLNGTLKISINSVDGFMSTQNIYLEDKTLGIIHDLKASDYNFTTLAGTFDQRFVLRYTNRVLGVGNSTDTGQYIVYKEGQQIIINSGIEHIAQIKVFDISGRLIYEANNINEPTAYIKNLPSANQVLLIDVLTNDGHKFIKKIIF